MTRRPRRVTTCALVALAALVAILTGCGRDDGADATAGGGDAPVLARADPDRCAANRAAGPITYLTGFDFGATVSILDVVVADELGYFADLCLDVTVQPGLSTQNVAPLSAGRAQLAGVGSFSEVAVASAAGADIEAVVVFGKTSVEQLIVEAGSDIVELADVPSAPMGVKGAIPYSIRAMLAAAGVDEGSITQIQVDFNPIVLFETDIETLPVSTSNEPRQLADQGFEFRVFDPGALGVTSTFGVIAANREFAAAHPTAVADFVRAVARGFREASADPDAAVAISLDRSDPDLFFSAESERFRWETERDLVVASTPAGQPVGAIDLDRLQAELDGLVELGVIPADGVDVASAADPGFVASVHDGPDLLWPEPGAGDDDQVVVGIDGATTTSLVPLDRDLPLGRIIPAPNSGRAPDSPNDPGGWQQLLVLGAIVGGMALIVGLVVREARRARRATR